MLSIYKYLLTWITVIVITFGAGWKVNGWRLGKEIENIKKEQAEEISKIILENQKKVMEADNELQNQKRIIADNVSRINRLPKYAKCNQTTTNSGDVASRTDGRSEQGSIDFRDVENEIIRLGAGRDECVAKLTALQNILK